jgi:hypothetical protein
VGAHDLGKRLLNLATQASIANPARFLPKRARDLCEILLPFAGFSAESAELLARREGIPSARFSAQWV